MEPGGRPQRCRLAAWFVQRIVAVHARISRTAREQGQQLKEYTCNSGAEAQPPSSPQIQAFASDAAQSPGTDSPGRRGDTPLQGLERQLQEALHRAAGAETELEFAQREHENERSVVQQLLADAGTLQAQLDALQSNSAIEVGLVPSCSLCCYLLQESVCFPAEGDV